MGAQSGQDFAGKGAAEVPGPAVGHNGPDRADRARTLHRLDLGDLGDDAGVGEPEVGDERAAVAAGVADVEVRHVRHDYGRR